MILYHGTDSQNEQSMIDNGVWPSDTNQPTRIISNGEPTETLQGRGLVGIYGWTTLQAALDWIRYTGSDCDMIVTIETGDRKIIDDPECEADGFLAGKGKFVLASEPVAIIDSKLIWEL